MQSLEARQLYKNSFHCAYKVWQENGITGFWKGTTPRLARLVVSNFSTSYGTGGVVSNEWTLDGGWHRIYSL